MNNNKFCRSHLLVFNVLLYTISKSNEHLQPDLYGLFVMCTSRKVIHRC